MTYSTVHVGDLVYLDSFAGLVPCKVVKVDERLTGPLTTDLRVTVRITASRGAYRRGEEETHLPHLVIPRDHVVRRDGRYRITGGWSFVPFTR